MQLGSSLFFALFLLLALSHLAQAIDLCIFFGTCGQNNNANNDRSDNLVVPDAIQVDADWVQPQDETARTSSQMYHFAKDASPMNWYDADQYCVNKGGFLAEPLSSSENDFLRGYASQFPKVNWWIGLREAEDCKCLASDARTVEFDANIDYDTLTNRQGNGYVKTKCPSVGTYSKRCDAKVWLWSYSGIRMSFSDWNDATNEPNGDNEHCVCLWAKEGYRWSDWHCNTDRFHDEATYKPICQKDVDSQDFGGKNDDEDTSDGGNGNDNNGNDDNADIIDITDDKDDEDDDEDSSNVLPDKLDCLEKGINYKSRKEDVISNIHQVESAQLCREMCAETDKCLYWTWLEQRRRKPPVCKLKARLFRTGFRRQKDKATSGTMRNGCNPNDATTQRPPVDNRGDFCVEYGAIYTGGDESKVVNNLNSMEDCRDRCLTEAGCRFYTFRNGRRGKKCELRNAPDFDTKYTRRASSGTINGQCRTSTLDEMKSQCSCVDVEPFRSRRNGGQRPSLLGLLGGAIDGRIANNDDLEDDDNVEIIGLESRTVKLCQKNQVTRCWPDGKSNDVTTTPRPRYNKGEYCIDYDVNYQQGDEFKKIRNVDSAESCRQLCLSESDCKYYVWKGNSRGKSCALKSSGLWIPKYEKGTVSGTVENTDCKFQTTSQYDFCECVELAPDYYDEDFVDIIETAINPKSGVCPDQNGRRCFSRVPLASADSTSGGTSSRIFFG